MLLEAVKPAWGQPLSSAHHALCLMCFSDTQNSLNSPLVDAIPSYIVEWPEKDTVKPQPRLPLHPTSPMTAYRTEGGTLSVLTALRNVHTVPHCPPICGFGGGGGARLCIPFCLLWPALYSSRPLATPFSCPYRKASKELSWARQRRQVEIMTPCGPIAKIARLDMMAHINEGHVAPSFPATRTALRDDGQNYPVNELLAIGAFWLSFSPETLSLHSAYRPNAVQTCKI